MRRLVAAVVRGLVLTLLVLLSAYGTPVGLDVGVAQHGQIVPAPSPEGSYRE